ncbi:hypothetical protein [Gloeobacter morelensis]|uniref:hypothetical protein n=1 Tax=Gloeobacter morelensis TaxID=2907343 RepID=UPI001E527077|nr:hypothetical protein [Gloeobacter morelensis]UFP97296.1 hypothetical protein ISF26_24570 [Gloeobacter morelensis MG652769]
MSENTEDSPLWMPDEKTRQGLVEQLRAARVGLRQSSEAIQLVIDELEQRQADSPLGRFQARQRAEAQANRAETA